MCQINLIKTTSEEAMSLLETGENTEILLKGDSFDIFKVKDGNKTHIVFASAIDQNVIIEVSQ